MNIIEKCLCGNELSLEWNNNEKFKMVRCPNCNNEMKFRNPNFNENTININTYENKLKKLLGNDDPFWFTTIDNFIKTTYEDKEQAIKDLEILAKDSLKFNEFTKQIIQRKDNLKSVKEEFLNFQNQDIQRATIDMARMMNYKMHAEQLYIPILNGFQVQNDNNPQTILLASGHGFMEQLTSDGYIEDGQFEKRIDLVINNTKQFMKNNGCENVENSFIYYKDYNNGTFNFKLYVQDMVVNIENQKKVIRAFIAYFVEPRMHDFYQLSLSVGPFTMPTEQLKIGIIDLEQDQITISLDNLMKTIMDNLKYKN